jgi:hypothetical protein
MLANPRRLFLVVAVICLTMSHHQYAIQGVPCLEIYSLIAATMTWLRDGLRTILFLIVSSFLATSRGTRMYVVIDRIRGLVVRLRITSVVMTCKGHVKLFFI